MPTSDIRILEYVSFFTKEDISILYRNKEYRFDAIKKFIISPTFWQSDDCNVCGKCCSNFGIAFFESELSKLQLSKSKIVQEELIPNLKKIDILYNGKPKNLYYMYPVADKHVEMFDAGDRTVRSCPFSRTIEGTLEFQTAAGIKRIEGARGCCIHLDRSHTCKFPHIRFYHNTRQPGIMRMGVHQYGRNWAMKCPISFLPFNIDEIRGKIQTLKDFYRDIQYLGTETWLPEIINYLETNLDLFVNDIPCTEIVFTNEVKNLGLGF